jgi:hypothetical protein
MGFIEVLATGKGDDKLELTEDGAANAAKVNDLLTKRYTIFVAVGEGETKEDKKVTGFDAEKNEFICAQQVTETKEFRYAAKEAKATAIAPIAGG